MCNYACVGFDIALSTDKHNLIVCLSLSTQILQALLCCQYPALGFMT